MSSTARYLKISVPVFPNEVEYYEPVSVPVSITNISPGTILIDSIELELQTDAGMVNWFKQTSCGHRVDSGDVHDEIVSFASPPELKENTCTFKVLVRFREANGVAAGNAVAELAEQNFYIINRISSSKFGQLFISLKQAADDDLADSFAVMARRAGFDPYMAKDDPQPGTDLWAKIENALKASKAAIIIWTSRTQMGPGVQREIELCKTLGVPLVLLIDEGVEIPEAYSASVEYQNFKRSNPATAFSKVLTTRRQVLLDP